MDDILPYPPTVGIELILEIGSPCINQNNTSNIAMKSQIKLHPNGAIAIQLRRMQNPSYQDTQ